MASSRTTHTVRVSRWGLSQLTLVEHSLCPLDRQQSLKTNWRHECNYRYADPVRGASVARATVTGSEGLSASDEFYLWGLLGLTFAQPNPSVDFQATPHWCLRQLGLITPESKGGKSYTLFREALRRLAAVRYQNDRFYDPIRREHREVSFGFFGYSLPVDPHSCRAWRIVWDTQFFEFCQASGSRLGFDLDLYRQFDPASRRLFLLLKKVFWRREHSPWFDLRQLTVDVLGFSADLKTGALKAKLRRVTDVLASHDVVQAATFAVRKRGEVAVRMLRGGHFTQACAQKPRPSWQGSARHDAPLRDSPLQDSPLYDPLRAIGFDDGQVGRILARFSSRLVQLWTDITLAAKESRGPSFFRKSPQAFFMNNIQEAQAGRRTPPDWFHALRKVEQLGPHSRRSGASSGARPASVKGSSLNRAIDRDADLERLVSEMMGQE